MATRCHSPGPALSAHNAANIGREQSATKASPQMSNQPLRASDPFAPQTPNSLNPSAAEFHLTQRLTILNRPIYNSLCRFHCHESGNRCHFGNACLFVHAQEFHRPTFGEQTASLLQAVHHILTFAVSCLLKQPTAMQTSAVPGFAAQQTAQHVPAEDSSDDLDLADLQPKDAVQIEAHDSADAKHSVDTEESDDEESDAKQTEQHVLDDDGTDALELADPQQKHAAKHETQDAADAKHSDFEDADSADFDADVKHSDSVPLAFEDANPTTKLEPIGCKPFESTLDVTDSLIDEIGREFDMQFDLDVLDETVNPESQADDMDTHTAKVEDEVKIDIPSTNDQQFKEQWIFLLANDPSELLARYPELLDAQYTYQIVGDKDAQLTNLKATKWNGHQVIVRDRVNKTRLSVIPFDYTLKHTAMSVKEENVRVLRPLNITDAFNNFKQDVNVSSWKILTMNETCYKNTTIIKYFVEHQFPFVDTKTKCYATLRFDTIDKRYDQLRRDTIQEVQAQQLGVTQEDCPKIISFLYSLAFSRKLHLVRTFSICADDWIMQKWKGNIDLYVPLPPNIDPD